MKRRITNFIPWLFLFVVGIGYGQIAGIEQITTHPSADYSAAVSPDGRWAAFVSERTGNKEIWIKEIPRGKTVQITSHPAEDFDPAWTPDSKSILFVSKRRDAAGDIWIISLNSQSGKPNRDGPRQITSYLGADLQPTASNGGESVIFSSDRGGQADLWQIHVNKSNRKQITVDGGTSPALSASGKWLVFVSDRFHPQGDLMLMDMDNPESKERESSRAIPITWGESIDGEPCWSYNKSVLIFSRINRDTDGDGRISPSDNRSLWIKLLSSTALIDPDRLILGRDEIQITSQTSDNFAPTCRIDDLVLFTSDRRVSPDIWTIPFYGLFPRQSDAAGQYRMAQEFEAAAQTSESLSQLLLGYQRVADFFPSENKWSARAMTQISSILTSMSREEEAGANLRNIVRLYGRDPETSQKAELSLAALAQGSLDERIERCRSLIDKSIDERTAAETELLLGDLLIKKGEVAEAVTAYNRAIEKGPDGSYIAAQAGLKMGDLFAQQGQESTARDSWLSVLSDFGSVPLWRERAGRRILNLVKGTEAERISGFQEIVDEMQEFPALAVEAQFATAEVLIKQAEWGQALRELGRIPQIAPELAWAAARSDILKASVLSQQQEELKAYILLEEVIDNSKLTDGGRYSREAADTLFNLYLRSAARLASHGDFFLAGVRYRRASLIKPDNIDARRGHIETAYRSNGLQKVVAEYQEELERKPADKITLYSLGLAYSYLGQSNPVQLELSNNYLNRALEEDYQLIYPYRTLGYNYELLENFAARKRLEKPGLGAKISGVLFAPLKWVGDLLSGKEKEEETGYYEKAIGVLSTALELNDEDEYSGMEAHLAQNLANNFYHLGEFGYRNALTYYTYRLSLDTIFTSPLEKATFFERAGRCGMTGDNLEEALRYLDIAIKTYNELGRFADARRNRRMTAFLYQLAEDYENAVFIYEELAVMDEAEGRLEEAERGYRNIAFNYHLMGEPDLVLQFGLRAVSLLEKRGFVIKPVSGSKLKIEIFGLSIPVWTLDEIGGASSEGLTEADEAALLYGLISRSYESLKSFSSAVEYEEKRLALFKRKKDKLAIRVSLHRLGKLSYQWARYRESWVFFNESRKLCKKSRDMHGMLTNIFNQSSTALAYLEAAGSDTLVLATLDRCRKVLNKKYKNYIMPIDEHTALLGSMGALFSGLALSRISFDADSPQSAAVAYNSLHLLTSADSCFQAALALEPSSRTRGEILKNMAEARFLTGEIEDALDYSKKSLSALRETNRSKSVWRVNYLRANLASIIQEENAAISPDSVLSIYKLAMDQLEGSPVNQDKSEEIRSDRKERFSLYVDAAFEMADQDYVKSALLTAERGLRKQVTDMLLRRPPIFKRERHKILWGNMRFLKDRLWEQKAAIYQEERGEGSLTELRRLRREQSKLESEYEDVLSDIIEEDMTLAWLSGSAPIEIDQSISNLKTGEGALIFLMGERETLIWAVDRDSLSITKIKYGRNQLAGMVDNVFSGPSVETETRLIQLHKILIAPVSEWIDSKESLIIIPDRDLWNLPFTALTDGEMALLDRVDIVFAPGLHIYNLACNNKKAGLKKSVVAGSPSDFRIGESVSVLTQNADILISRESAGETDFIKSIQDADLIHAERWSLFYENDPFNSALALYRDNDSDGYLRSIELFTNDLRAELFVLPPTPAGQIRKWDAPLSFFYSLLYTGVPTVVTRTRAVDKTTSELWAKSFYENLKIMSAASALAETQYFLRDSLKSAAEWSPFQIIGFGGFDAESRIEYARKNLVAHVREGQAYEQQGEFLRALNLYDQAAGMASLLQDSLLEERMLDISLAASVGGSLWTRAALYQNQIEANARRAGKTDEVKTSLKNLIAIYRRGGRLEDAAEAENRYNQMLGLKGNLAEQARSSREMAMILALDRKWEEALIWADKACSLFVETGDEVELGQTLLRKGRINLEADNFWKAQQDLEQGIALLEKHQDEQLLFEIGSGYQLLGLTTERMTRYSNSLKYQRKGLAVFEGLGRKAQTAQGIQYLANLFWKMGDFRSAMLHQERALALFKELDDAKLLSMGYSTQGLISMGLGENDQAREQMKRALRLAESSGNREDESTILKNLGLLSIKGLLFSESEQYFQNAVAIDSAINSRAGLAYSYRNLGILKARMNQASTGIPLLEKSLLLSQELGDQRNIIQSYYGLGLCLAQTGNHSESTAMLDSGLVLNQSLNMPDLEWRLLWMRARSLRSSGSFEKAQTDYSAAITVVETMRQSLSAEAFKQGFLEDKSDLYADMIDFLMELKRPGDALEIAERAKSRSFIDMLAGQTGGRVTNIELDQGYVLQDSLDEIRSLIGFLQQPASKLKPEETELLESYIEKVLDLESQYQQLITKIQAENPESASLVQVEPLQPRDVQALLPDSTALIEYYVNGSDIYIWVVLPDKISQIKVTAPGGSLENIVRGFRDNILSFLSADIEAKQLYTVLIKPVLDRIEDVNHLVIIPHSILHYCPFSALQNQAGEVLLDRFSISLAPSSTVLGFCRDKARSRGENGDIRILAVSNPNLGPEYDLPFADREVSALERTFDNVTVLAGEEATETAVRAGAAEHDILHFACHAEFNAESPLFSTLLLSPERGGNGRLETHELFTLSLDCDLVTLSACESGLGKIAGGDDIIGLSRGFIFAGAPALVTSLWKVEDLATAVLIKRFYRYLEQGMNKSEALRQAQLWVRNQISPQPSAWAGFNLIGEFE